MPRKYLPVLALSMAACHPGLRVDSSCSEAERALLLETSVWAQAVLSLTEDSGASVLDEAMRQLYPGDVHLKADESTRLASRTTVSCLDAGEMKTLEPGAYSARAMWKGTDDHMIWNRAFLPTSLERHQAWLEVQAETHPEAILTSLDAAYVNEYEGDCSAFRRDNLNIHREKYVPMQRYYQEVLMPMVGTMVHEWGHEYLGGHDGQEEVELNTELLQSWGIYPSGIDDDFSCMDESYTWGHAAEWVFYSEFMAPLLGSSAFHQECQEDPSALAERFYQQAGRCLRGTRLD